MTLDRSVVQAFQDVANAMADREKVINEARLREQPHSQSARRGSHAAERGGGLQAAARRRRRR